MRIRPSSRSRRRFRAGVLLLAIAAACTPGDQAGQSDTASQVGATTQVDPALLDPDPNAISQPAPDSFRVAFETTKGRFVVQARRDWAPRGADRFYHLVRLGYFDDVRFFRVLHGFMAQFGMHGNPAVVAAWEPLELPDDPVKQSNRRGTVSFATKGPNTRTTQLFINYADNANLDAMGFAPFAEVVEGMAVVDSLYGDYGEGAPQGSGPDQTRITREGNAYLQREFPRLDYIKTARLLQ